MSSCASNLPVFSPSIGSAGRLLLLILISLSVGCSSEETSKPLTVQEALAQAQKTASQLEPRPEPLPAAPAEPPVAALAADDAAVQPTGTYKVRFETSAGDFVIEVRREWAPIGAQRFYELVKSGFYDDCRFFRVLPGFMVQFGINGNPIIQSKWERNIKDDPVRHGNKKGYVTFATAGPGTRTTQVFINYVNNGFLDAQGFAPFGEVIEGMSSVQNIYSAHGETPDQGQINQRGNAYLNESFPKLDYIRKAEIIGEKGN
jgi:peptidyl-prolyl cis-trans isomerase A (cyclophilin A)